MITVGIPRALLYYHYYPMWRTFFESLGGQVVISEPTSREMVAQGSARLVADTCLPAKVFCGHILSLASKCDYLFIPSIKSIEANVYNCSKFLGLPDVIRAVVPKCPPIIDVDIDVNKGQRPLYQAIYQVGRKLTWNPVKVRRAALEALESHSRYRTLMHQEGLTPIQAIQRLYGETNGSEPTGTHQEEIELRVAVTGHPYILYDDYITHRLLRRFHDLGVKVLTPEMASNEELGQGVQRLIGRPYWTFEDEVVGAGGHYLESAVDGVVSVVAFGCGPDSVMLEVVQRYVKRHPTNPYMALTIDEHTGEAGLVTRIEAFLDMVKRRKRLASCA